MSANPPAPRPLQEGDVYQWRYTEARMEAFGRSFLGNSNVYWTKDQQAVVRDGKLCDTYWSFGQSGDSAVLVPSEVELTFVCNLGDMEPAPTGAHHYFDDADIFDLSYNHRCVKRVFLRKGAQRSREKMLATIDALVRERTDDIDRAQRQIVTLKQTLTRILTGDINAVYF